MAGTQLMQLATQSSQPTVVIQPIGNDRLANQHSMTSSHHPNHAHQLIQAMSTLSYPSTIGTSTGQPPENRLNHYWGQLGVGG